MDLILADDRIKTNGKFHRQHSMVARGHVAHVHSLLLPKIFNTHTTQNATTAESKHTMPILREISIS